LSARHRWWAVALVFGIVAAWVPYRDLLWQLPWGSDASKWVRNGSLDNEACWHFVTGAKHFIGYRPVTAATFVLNQALFGYEAWSYRALDLALHLGAGLLVFAVHRELTGRRDGWALVPMALLLLHPATEEVVPYVARRSYLLAMAFGLGAVVVTLRGVGRTGRGEVAHAVVAGVLLGVAVLSNEVAYVLLPLMPLFAAHVAPAGARIRATAVTLPALALCVLAVLRRYWVLGVWGGGYGKRYFAIVSSTGRPMWRELSSWQPRRILEACWQYLLTPNSVAGDPALVDGDLGIAVSAVLFAWLVWFCVVRVILRYDEREARTAGLMGLWMAGSVAIIVLSQTWFWRQAYSLLPPLGITLAISVSAAVHAIREREVPEVVQGLVAGWVLLGAVLRGPAIGGMDPAPHRGRMFGTEIVQQMRELVAETSGPGIVWMVVPLRPPAAHLVRTWGDRLGATRGLQFRLLAHLDARSGPRDARVALVPNAVVLQRGLVFADNSLIDLLKPRDGALSLRALARQTHGEWIMVIDTDHTESRSLTAP